jgi:murein DD-endopeptidase MepM/ murein hydrolase activator NlpD
MTTKHLCSVSRKKSLASKLKAFKPKLYALIFALGVFTTLTLPVALTAQQPTQQPTQQPQDALQVQVSPKNPRLGDTISLMITRNSSSNSGDVIVTTGKDTFKAFEVPPNKYRAFIPTTPLEKPGIRAIKVSAGGEIENLSVQVANRKFPVQRINLPPGKAGVKATELELRRAREFRETVSSEKFWDGPFLHPNKGRKSTPYGVRRYYNGVFANDYYHRGLDYASGTGSPVVAPAPGRVSLVGRVSQGFRVHGNIVGIDHGQGVGSILMHLNSINVKEGDMVKAGQKVGTVGSTGASTGPHLHWGLYVNGKSVDPKPWTDTGLE